MTLTYSLDADDYLQFHLFNSSKNKRSQKKRRNSWIILFVSAFLLAFVLYGNDDKFLSYYFIVVGVLTIVFYPKYAKRRWRKHFEQHVLETHKNNFGETSTIVFNDNFIESSDRTGTSKINISEIEKIYETGQYFFARLKSGQNLIIPKDKIDALATREELKKIAIQINAEFIEDLNWQW